MKIIIFTFTHYTFISCAGKGPEPIPAQTGEEAEILLVHVALKFHRP